MEVTSSGEDEVFGQFDCNDNTPVLEPKTMALSPTSPQQQHHQQQVIKQIGKQQMESDTTLVIARGDGAVSPPITRRAGGVGGMAATSPVRCPSNASSTSDSNATYLQGGGAASLTDENTNNDFFYDDEFTGFDDNLCEGAPEQEVDARMLDSTDINNILSMSRLVNDDNEPALLSKIAASKSDSCLYQGDLSMSSEGAMAISQDQSFSEGDVVSSSDLSELRSEPLFSPPPDDDGRNTPSFAQLSPMDSLIKSGSLNNSFLTEEERYAFDWTANKDKYMISCVQDEDSSLQDSCPGAVGGGAGFRASMTSWAQRSSGQITWSSHCSSTGSSKESGTESPLPSGCGAEIKSNQPRPRTKSLTSWAHIKKGSSDEKLDTTLPSGLTTWRSLKEETTKKEVVDTGVKSKSLPDLPKKTATDSNESLKPESFDLKKSTTSKDGSLHASQLEELLAKKNVNSGSLLELFQRLKSQQDDLMSPGAVQHMMMGTWSMSDASSGVLLSPERTAPASPAPSAPPLTAGPSDTTDLRLKSWNTIKNLNRSKSSSTSYDSLVFSSSGSPGNNSSSSMTSSSNNKLKHSFSCGTSSNNSAQHSIGIGSSSLLESRDLGAKESRDFASQFPPRFSDCCIQTSFEERERVLESKNQCLQTSLEDNIHARWQQSDPAAPPPKPPRQPHLQKTRSADSSPCPQPTSNRKSRSKTDSDGLSNKMSDSILNNLSKLPDLSFLNRNITADLAFLNGGMTRSASSSDEFSRGPIFRPISSMKNFMRPLSLFHPGHDEVPRKTRSYKNHERKRASSVDPNVECRRSTSSSRETSPVNTTNTRRRNYRGRERSPSDFCSSSSSGIDPGSMDSQGTRTPQYFSDLALFSPSNSDCNSASSAESDTIVESLTRAKLNARKSCSIDDIRGLKFSMPKITDEMKPKDVRIMQLKEEAKLCKQMETAELGGHTRGRKKSTEYIDVKDRENVPKLSSCNSCERCSSPPTSGKLLLSLSPSNSWSWSPTTSMESSHNNNSDPKTECVHFEVCQRQTTCRTVVMSGICEKCSPSKDCVCQKDSNAPCPNRKEAWVHHAECLQNDTKNGLKPCLVKRRKARKAPMKHRSWSDTRDLAVMRYSQEGQTRYQLIMPPCGKECVHGLSSKSVAFTSLPADVLLKSIGEQVVKAAGGKLHLQHVDSEHSGETGDCDTAEQNKKPGCCINVPAASTVTTSPEPIPTMPCPCCQSSGCCTSSACSSFSQQELPDGRRARKSVSFSEEISYHSPYPSPHPSPKKQVHPIVPSSTSSETTVIATEVKPVDTTTKCQEGSVTSLSSDDSGPPTVFQVSPPSSVEVSPSRTLSPSASLHAAHKHELVVEMMKGTEIVMAYFAAATDAEEKLRMGSTAHCEEIGHLVLQHICPPIYVILMDGLHPQVRSVFGKMRNSVWKVIEDSAEHGPTVKVVNELVRQLKTIDFLSTSWLRFNAFVFGLLNNKSLDFWLAFLRTQDGVLSRHYGSDSFVLASDGAEDQVYTDVISVLRPLAQLPFRLDYDFELKELHEQKYVSTTTVATPSCDVDPTVSGASSTASLNSFNSFTSSSTPTASTMGKQTKELLQQGSRLLSKLPTQTSLLSWGSSTLGSMFSNSKMKALAGSLSPTGHKAVPELKGINDDTEATTPSSVGSEVFRSAEEPKEPMGVIDAYSKMIPAQPTSHLKAIPVVKNNEILAQEYYEDSLEGSQLASPASEKIHRIAKQMVGISSPEKKLDNSAYKRGITEYTFDVDIETSVRDMKAKILAERQNSCSCDSLERSLLPSEGSPKKERLGSPGKVLSVSGLLRQCDAGTVEVEVKPVPQISMESGDSGIDDYRLEACAAAAPSDFQLPIRPEVIKSDTTGNKRWSDTEANKFMTNKSNSSSKLETSITKAKKRWSTFGPTMIKLLDKMLLPEEKEVKKVKPVPPPKPKRMATIDVASTEEDCSSRAPLERAHTISEDTTRH